MVVGAPPEIRPDDLPVRHPRTAGAAAGDVSLAELERRHIADVLERSGWNISRTAEILDVDRATIYNKIKRYGLERPELDAAANIGR